MNTMSSALKWLEKSIPILLGIGIIVLILLRIEVATQRFFDVDEFTHLHWAAQIFMGDKPYLDFFTFFPPGYHWMLQPLFVLFRDSASIFVVGRFLSVIAFFGILVVTAIFFARLRSVKYALLPVFILAFLPMPYDKYFEIRPDTWSSLFGFIGVLLLSYGWRESVMKRKKIIFFVAGVVFSICLLVLPKMLPFVIVAALVEVGRTSFELLKQRKITVLVLQPLLFLIAGGGVIALLFLLWMASLGDFGMAWYSLTKEGVEGNQIGKYFIMEPHLFFFPNSSFYGGEGITISYITNHAIWFFAIFVATIRLFTPFITTQNNKTTILDELVLSGIFFTSVYGYIYYFPLKHTQYLIPIGIFIAFYAADGLTKILKHTSYVGTIGLVGLIILGIVVNKELNVRKLWWKNFAQLEEYELLLKTIPRDATVVDMEGKMLTWKHGYYVCCLAWGQFGGYLSRPLPSLTESLQKNKVEYIYQGDSGRLGTVLPQDLTYIYQNYFPVDGWNEKLFKRKN